MPTKIDLSGERFGRLVVIEDTGRRNNSKKIIYLCECDCGNKVEKTGGDLRSGDTRSCGCLKTDLLTKHDGSKTRLYGIWRDMLSRCRCKNSVGYKYYGIRGITVCEEWTDFSNFQKWSLNNGYDEKLTIDRIDVNGGYQPSNCRWATRKEQNRNKRNSVCVEINGKMIHIKDLSDETMVEYSVIRERLKKGYRGDDLITEKHQGVTLEKFKEMKNNARV